MRFAARLVLPLCLLGAHAAGAAAQCLPTTIPPEEAPPCTNHYPAWSGELASLGANALLGALTAGVMQEVRGGSFRSGFTRGAIGGAGIYLGKRIAVERFDGAGLLGRQVAAVAGSMVRNAGEGRGSLARLYLPLGVARLEVETATRRLQLTPDLTAIGWTLWAASERELGIDWGESLSSGTPVFITDNKTLVVGGDSTHASGVTSSGIVILAGIPGMGPTFDRRVREHERVHMLQQDQFFLTLTDPLEELLLRQLPYARRVATRIDINLGTEFMKYLGSWFPAYLDRPWESEAIFHSR